MSISALDYLSNLTSGTMIISVCNPYVFSKKVLSQHGIIAINYHNSLLPLHKGVNAEAWAIFEQDAATGITWHIIYPEIDKGPIIYQEKLYILPDETSLQLLARQNKEAYNIFYKNIDTIIRLDFIQIEQIGKASCHFKKDIPNNGFLDTEWKIDKAYAFLRAMNYGHLYTLGFPKIIIYKDVYTWKSYSLNSCIDGKREDLIQDDIILLNYDDGQIKLNHIKKLADISQLGLS